MERLLHATLGYSGSLGGGGMDFMITTFLEEAREEESLTRLRLSAGRDVQ
jgi:hypothetical protein